MPRNTRLHVNTKHLRVCTAGVHGLRACWTGHGVCQLVRAHVQRELGNKRRHEFSFAEAETVSQARVTILKSNTKYSGDRLKVGEPLPSL